jgi:aminoglycoside phosphotransferase (APT) family kinase protein
VFTDGTPDQAAEVAAWVAENFPPDGVEVWLTDDAHTRHIVLTPGMTPADVVAAPWQPH